MSLTQNLANKATTNNSDEIDLGKLFGILIDSRWSIIVTTLLFTIAGIAYALLATPIYKADALIQVEQKNTGMPALGGDMAELFSSESTATTEIEIIKSRMVLGETVDKLNLTVVAIPNYLPVIGKGLARLSGESASINISRFTLPEYAQQNGYVLTVTNSEKGQYTLANSDGREVLQGRVGELVEKNGISLFVTDIHAKDEATFTLSKISRLDAIQNLQRGLSISERGKQTGILQLSMTGENRSEIKDILNDISQNYFCKTLNETQRKQKKFSVFKKTPTRN